MLIKNIAEIFDSGLTGPCWMRVDTARGTISGMGDMDSCPTAGVMEETLDARGGTVLPSYCDSHTHIVYAGSRHGEFLDKINGLTYEEIAARGGGILNSADLLHETSEDDLFRQSMARADEVMLKGTGSIEIKSGYGLTLEDELKMLRVIARIREASPMTVRTTFLGAHAVGRAFTGRQGAYVDHVVNDMIPAVAAEGLAEFVDVFCDAGFFTPEETARILEAGARYGMRPKIHANELAVSGGVETGIAYGALSVDHLERAEVEQIAALAASDTVATMLPGASFFSNLPYAPARRALDAGCKVALASDYNPGSSPSGDMRFVWALGCIKMRLTPAEALRCCTVGGAMAMDLADSRGRLAEGMRADFIITRPLGPNTPEAPSLAIIPYAYNTPYIDSLWLGGRRVSA